MHSGSQETRAAPTPAGPSALEAPAGHKGDRISSGMEAIPAESVLNSGCFPPGITAGPGGDIVAPRTYRWW
jgi:hypothetical protein